MNQDSTNQPNHPMADRAPIAMLKGVIGAVVAGVIGYFLYRLLLNNGYYAIAIPGGFVGIGYGLAARKPSMIAGICCGIAGLFFGFWCDAVTMAPPETLFSYLAKFNQKPQTNLILICIGAFMSAWFGRGR